VAHRTVYLAIAAALLIGLAGCSPAPDNAASGGSSSTGGQSSKPSSDTAASALELKIEDTKVGTGAAAKAGDSVTVDYTGWLEDGTKFDSSKDAGKPFTFVLGAGEVIAGWDQGVAGMKVGGVRKLTVPSELGYGAAGAGGVIPPYATLVFEVELLSIQ